MGFRVQDFGLVEPLESNGKKFITVIGVYIRTYIHIYIGYIYMYNIHTIRIYVNMYVCMYVYMHIYMCVYVCICMYVCMYVCMYACMHVCMYACMHVCTYVCMYACMYVCIYTYSRFGPPLPQAFHDIGLGSLDHNVALGCCIFSGVKVQGFGSGLWGTQVR